MEISSDEPFSLEIGIDFNVFSYCLTVFERYESLLSEFGDINGCINHDNVIHKIDECASAVRNILELDDGSFVGTLHGLLSSLERLSDSINTRKIKEASRNSNKHMSVKNEAKITENSSSKFISSVQNTIEIPRVNGLNSLAGLEEVKKILRTMFLLPIRQPQLFLNRKTSNKLLLFGPPGTGKTLLTHAIAAEIKAVFHNISSSDILSAFVGESEKMIKCLFQQAKQNNCYTIIFMDEIDAFCRRRDSSDQQHSRRLTTELMCQMNMIEDCPNVFVIGATNCPWDLDAAILRRFQKRIYIPLPDKSEREELLRFYTNQTNLLLYEATAWRHLQDLTEGFSTSDIASLVQDAMDIPLMELQETRVWNKTIDDVYEPADREEEKFHKIIWKRIEDLPENSVRARPLKLSDLITVAENYKPTVSQELVIKYEAFNKK